MRRRTAHKLDEMPVFLGRVAVTHDVAYYLRVYLCSGVETERGLNFRVLQVAVDSLRTSNNLYIGTDSLIVFCKHAGIGVRVVATYDDESLDIKSLENFETFVELLLLLKLCTSRTDDVETTGVAVLVDNVGSEFHIVVVNETSRTEDETIETVLWIEFLYAVKQS